jgi:hypothetical protein
MTLFSALGPKRLALLAIVFVIGVACAKVDRGYDDVTTAGTGGADGGKAGSEAGGSGNSGGRNPGNAGSAGESGEAGSAGESSAGAGGAASGTLTVSLAGDGKGVVTSDVPGIDCGTQCSAEFDPDTEVVLTAKPAANSTFAGWAGGGCSGLGPCLVVVSEAIEVRATFTSVKVGLSLTLAGNGSGSVKSVPAGIDCGSTCSTQVAQGSSVQLTATAAMGSVFVGWSGGGCTGTGVCTTTVNAATAVTATFALAAQTLTVVKAGTGLGTVTSSPAGINCGTTCSQNVNNGSMVTLTAAVTGTGSVFSGWSGGGCSGTGACVVTVAAATQVTATFTCSPGTTTFSYTGLATTFTVPTCVTALTIDAYGASGGNGSATYVGGLGARMKGTVAVTGGAVLKVLVGGKGADATDTTAQAGGSGGGGTFVTTSTNAPLMVAGGGGGGCAHNQTTLQANGRGGSIGTAGLADTGSVCTPATGGAGGTTGSNSGGYHAGTGAGGLTGNGIGNSDGNAVDYGAAYTPGMSFLAGGAPGQPGTGTCGTGTSTLCKVGRAGGFGGGGAAGMTAGGGGGYSGGCGGTNPATAAVTPSGGGGGGGSYNAGTAQSNTAATWSGAGKVTFTW